MQDVLKRERRRGRPATARPAQTRTSSPTTYAPTDCTYPHLICDTLHFFPLTCVCYALGRTHRGFVHVRAHVHGGDGSTRHACHHGVHSAHPSTRQDQDCLRPRVPRGSLPLLQPSHVTHLHIPHLTYPNITKTYNNVKITIARGHKKTFRILSLMNRPVDSNGWVSYR